MFTRLGKGLRVRPIPSSGVGFANSPIVNLYQSHTYRQETLDLQHPILDDGQYGFLDSSS